MIEAPSSISSSRESLPEVSSVKSEPVAKSSSPPPETLILEPEMDEARSEEGSVEDRDASTKSEKDRKIREKKRPTFEDLTGALHLREAFGRLDDVHEDIGEVAGLIKQYLDNGHLDISKGGNERKFDEPRDFSKLISPTSVKVVDPKTTKDGDMFLKDDLFEDPKAKKASLPIDARDTGVWLDITGDI